MPARVATTLRRRLARLLVLMAPLALAACSEGFVAFPVTEPQQRELADDIGAQIDIVRLDATNIVRFTEPARGFARTTLPAAPRSDYIVGRGDVLRVIVFDHPELSIPSVPIDPDETPGAGVAGFAVQTDGTFNYPFIGEVQAAGRRADEIRADLAQRLSVFIPDPQVDLRVTGFNARSVTVTGEVARPSRQRMTSVQLTLLEAVNAAGGLTQAADSSNITVRRGGRSYSVDLDGFLEAGIARNNPLLRDGDVVNVPRSETQEAYLLGEVGRPGVVQLANDVVTLTQALARQGGLDEVRADARGIFVFRVVDGRQTVYQLDISNPTGLLLGTRFVLQPDDVIYIVRAPLTRWNDTITRILPTIQVYSAAEALTD
ncbi:MAG: polysaccharide biosynthesis/export family protein [Shimia sp.]